MGTRMRSRHWWLIEALILLFLLASPAWAEEERIVGIGRLRGLRIGIDPGHQETPDPERERIAPDTRKTRARVAPGTTGIRSGKPEYAVNLEISLALREALRGEDAEVILTRETNDVHISNYERARLMNEQEADLVLRIHCNGSGRKTMHGIGIYVSKSYGMPRESKRAADCILARLAETTGAKPRGVSRRDTYTGLNWLQMPGLLIECGYLTNPREDELLNQPEYQRKLAAGILEGVCDYFGR